MSQITRTRRPGRVASEGPAEVEALAWLLDNSIPVPLTGGRRIGLDAIIGLVPFAGDLTSAGIGLYVIWRAARLGVPGVVVARMLLNWAIDLSVGAIPVLGDGFDLWFKANTRNIGLMRRHLADPTASTRGSWVMVGALALSVLLVVALIGWLLAGLIGLLMTPIG